MRPPEPTAPRVMHELDELVPMLDSEATLIAQLTEALVRQRGHVGAGDATAIQQGADEISRTLLAIDETRRQRVATVAAFATDPGTPLSGLAARLGRRPSPAFERARLELERAAALAQHEAAVNHEVLRRAMESGEAFLQALFASVNDPSATYGPERRPDAGANGLFVNRTA